MARKKTQVKIDPPREYMDMWLDPILKLKGFDERVRYRKQWANKKRGDL